MDFWGGGDVCHIGKWPWKRAENGNMLLEMRIWKQVVKMCIRMKWLRVVSCGRNVFKCVEPCSSNAIFM